LNIRKLRLYGLWRPTSDSGGCDARGDFAAGHSAATSDDAPWSAQRLVYQCLRSVFSFWPWWPSTNNIKQQRINKGQVVKNSDLQERIKLPWPVATVAGRP
jgi:hypothetical protein